MNGSQESLTFDVAPIVNPIISTERKRCAKCGEMKKLTEYHKSKNEKDGLATQCKGCRRIENAEYRNINKKRIQIVRREYYQLNKEVIKENSRKYLSENKLKAKERDKKRRGAINKWHSEWEKKNHKRWREINNKANRKRRSTARGKLNHNMSTYVRRYLKEKKGERKWESILGYTVETLKKHLEKLFKEGMTWNNYGRGWHIDHKVPLAAFNFESSNDIDFKAAWALKNLQPLWAEENMKKHTMLDKPFQPSLLIGSL